MSEQTDKVVTSETRGRKVVTPASDKDLRCCRKCHIIRTEEEFRESGCPNCNAQDGSRFSADRYGEDGDSWVKDNTTADFQGMAAVFTPGRGIVATAFNVPRLFSCFSPFLFISLISSFHSIF